MRPAGAEVPSREAHLSAEPPRPQATARVPLAHGHDRREEGDRRPQGARAQAPVGLSEGAAPLVLPEAQIVRLRRRREFLAAAWGLKAGAKAFTLQAVRRTGDMAPCEIGIGITVTRKIGGAVVRNRARRRLREALRRVAPERGRPGHDYVVVARPPALTQPFHELVQELDSSFNGLGRRLARTG